jgi:SAM-dependent methyltransferase
MNPAFLFQAHQSLDQLEQTGLLPKDVCSGRYVLDWECGRGYFSLALLERGAKQVLGIDSWYDASEEIKTPPSQVRFMKCSISDLETHADFGFFDVIFANTVTEHLPDLHNQLRQVARALKPGGRIIINHDNYYQPVGSHDHGFLGDTGHGIHRLGPDCWNSKERCEASASFRDGIKARFPWTWDDNIEERLDPSDCRLCPYYRRSQPWGHLLYQDFWLATYPQLCFSTGLHNSGLNKLSPTQVRQAVVEAGFSMDHYGTTRARNSPPVELLPPHTEYSDHLLTTWMVQVRATKTSA